MKKGLYGLIVIVLAITIPVVSAQDLTFALSENFTSVDEWSHFEGAGTLTSDGVLGRLESEAGDVVAYETDIPPTATTTYDVLYVAISNNTGHFLCWVAGSRTTLVMNESGAGEFQVDLNQATQGDIIQKVLIGVNDGVVYLSEMAIFRSRPPNAAEQFEMLFNQFLGTESGPWMISAFVIIGILIVFGILFIPPRDTKSVRRLRRR